MNAMILAAGFGTRFRPVTYDIPKPMIPLCNRPLIDFAVDSLLTAGVRDIVVNLHHFPERIERHLTAVYGDRSRFHFSLEPEILGTGGGIRKARSFLEKTSGFFLVNADTIQFPPFDRLQRALEETGALAALLLRHRPPDESYTKVYFDGTYVTGFRDGAGEALMFSGSHAVSRRIFDYLPDRDFSGITEDVYLPLLQDGREKLAGSVDDGLWFDIGTPRRYLFATDAVRAEMLSGGMPLPTSSRAAERRSIVHEAATIRGKVEDSVVGEGSVVDAMSRVSRSILWQGCHAGSESTIEDSILADGVELPAGSVVRNAMVCVRRDDRRDPSENRVGNFVVVPIDPDREFLFHAG